MSLNLYVKKHRTRHQISMSEPARALMEGTVTSPFAALTWPDWRFFVQVEWICRH